MCNRFTFPISMAVQADHYLCNSIGSNIIFTTYHALTRAMPNNWKNTMRGEPKQFILALPPVLLMLLKDQKGTKNIRSVWTIKHKDTIPIGQEKWSLELENENIINWKKDCRLCTYHIFSISNKPQVVSDQ